MKTRIMVVDDDMNMRDLMITLLESEGYDVIPAENAAAAQAAFDGPQPDAALLDLQLPDGHGLDLLPIFKKHWPETEVIVLTGNATLEAAVEATKRGAIFFQSKPVDPKNLMVLVKRALETLKGRARVKRTMWSRRAQEYEAKINSGDIVAIAEVVRDLYRSESQPEQSYSERQLYEAALDRLSREIAVVQHSTETEAVKEIESQLAKSPRRGAKTEAEGIAEADEADTEADGDDAAVADEAA